MKKIIFIFFHPPTLSLEQNYYFPDLIQNGINIEVWDITYILFGNLRLKDEIEADYIKKINSKKDFERCLSKENVKKVIFVIVVSFFFKSLWLYRTLTKHKCTICFFERGTLPDPVGNRYKKIFKLVKNYEFQEIYKNIKNRIPQFYKKFKLVKDFDFVFAAGNKAENLHNNNSKVISINSFDYDKYLEVQKTSLILVKKRYCVFLDEFLPSHPDFSILRVKTLDSSSYYQKINKFFDIVENRFRLKVIIAAHPKSDYTNNPFGGRPCFIYKTSELVKNCEFVIAHDSTSISFAVLFKKPIILIYDNEIKYIFANSKYLMILSCADALGCSVHNIDDFFQIQQITIPEIDTKKYEEYKYKHLTSKISEGKFSKDIFLDHIIELINAK